MDESASNGSDDSSTSDSDGESAIATTVVFKCIGSLQRDPGPGCIETEVR